MLLIILVVLVWVAEELFLLMKLMYVRKIAHQDVAFSRPESNINPVHHVVKL